MKDYNSFEELEVWKSCRAFRKSISAITKQFPPHEQFELTRQIKRSSRSVTANVAEGHGRYGFKDNTRFVRISSGSLKETLDHLYVALDEEYITQKEFDSLKTQYLSCQRLINGYISYLKNNGKL
jgi:four helix bundle protein